MNTILTSAEEQKLRDHFNTKISPRYKPQTITKIIEAVNKIRIGEMKDTDFVNPITKIVDWSCYFEIWGLYQRKFVELKTD